MIKYAQYALSPSLARSVEDAILFGHVKEIDMVLNILEIDNEFPEDLRYGLEALRHFREHYGKNGPSEPKDHEGRKKVALTESMWGAELLERLKNVEVDEIEKTA